ERGAELKDGLEKLKGRFDFIGEVRGEGLILGLNLSIEGAAIVEEALRQGLIINCTHEHILRFLPPFVIRTQHVREFLSTLGKVLAKAPRNAWEDAKQAHDAPRIEETAGARAQAAVR
ncbi:MAG: aminotransferase class III-fold pyridoxal phosphate-dependent enzyme, partial [Candidatus Acidiferrales bacterium]